MANVSIAQNSGDGDGPGELVTRYREDLAPSPQRLYRCCVEEILAGIKPLGMGLDR
jgi:hypothetical protein